MPKYEMYGVKYVLMEIEADNLEDAIHKCQRDDRYNIHAIDENTKILIDGKLLENEDGDIIFSDIYPLDWHKY